MSKKHGKGRKVKIQRVRLSGEASEEAALRIEELARGLRSGVIHLAGGDVAIEAPAGSDLTWEIEARSGRRKSRIEIEIRWRSPESQDEDEDDEDEDASAQAAQESTSDPLAAGFNPQSTNEPQSSTSPEEDKPSSELENPAW